MEKPKKTEVITFRTDKNVKDTLEEMAEYYQWTIAKVVEQIIINFISDPAPGKITIKTDELYRAYKELKENRNEGVKLEIDIITENEYLDDEETIRYRGMRITGLEAGGLGACSDFDPIKELSYDEILDIP